MSGPNMELRDAVYNRVEELCDIARTKSCAGMHSPHIGYYTGRNAAGYVKLESNHLRLHTVLLEENREEMLDTTCAHEIAHLCVYNMAERGLCTWKSARSHGRDWKHVMRHWFNIEPERRHNFDMTNAGARSRQRKWGYSCECDTYEISTTRHNRIVSGKQTYHCRKCAATIKRIPKHGLED